MKLLIVSDSHGMEKELLELKEKHRHEVDMMIHCGDSELQADAKEMAEFVAVRGNCDFEARFVEDHIQKVGDYTLFVTHGHHYGVKSSLMNLSYRAKELSADIVCFGHSHLLGAEMLEGTLYINPGSLRLPRRRVERSYVILELKEKLAELRVYDFDQGEIVELQTTFTFLK